MTAASAHQTSPVDGGANGTKKPAAPFPSHPLGSLTAEEIRQSSRLIVQRWPEGTPLQFKSIKLQEPAKKELVPYLAAERAGKPVPAMDRRSEVHYLLGNTAKFHVAIVNLSRSAVESHVLLGPHQHPNADGEEILALEDAVLKDPVVLAEIAKLQLPEGSVIVTDPWIYGSDGVKNDRFYDDKRLVQCYLYMRDPDNAAERDSCHYAFPLPLSPVVDTETKKVVRIDVLPTGLDEKVRPLAPWKPVPPNEYIPEAQPRLRTDLKPLQVHQPEGASFTVEHFAEMGQLIRWQKWELKVGFNQREGMVLYDVHYDGHPLFYRLSLSDMAIPYADPRSPYHRKQAFDLGDVGAGLMANNLQLGCDCLGSIYYISGVLADARGQPVRMPNVICVHEQDAGLLSSSTWPAT
ncbi:hypothetical protein VTK73DRAFT_4427 [Phialemonium thermophilum]|uniref:Amine oxidase n=1 Tax=Phialemonium thermophilum TaxID=223376 RepID=A0ABR3V900_9PEZI